MNKLVLGLMTLTFVGSAFARSPMYPAPMERVLVKNVANYGNFMPGPGPRPHGGSVLTVQVDSNGCTGAEDFRVQVRTLPGPTETKYVRIIRVTPDTCRAFFPEGTEVELRTQFLGFNSDVIIENPVRVEDRTTH